MKTGVIAVVWDAIPYSLVELYDVILEGSNLHCQDLRELARVVANSLISCSVGTGFDSRPEGVLR
jgi:hypothetical protein